MISMKKTALAAAMVMSLGTGVAQAAHVPVVGPVVQFSYAGTFTMLDPGGGFVGSDPALVGSMDMDMGTGAGHASMYPSTTFFGYTWTAHGITLAATGPGTVMATMLFDWGVTANIPVTADFSMTPIGPKTFTITTLDGDFDGIPGNAMCCGPFAGFNATFGGTATIVPVPAAVWLLGSGLLGLVGVARRKKSA